MKTNKKPATKREIAKVFRAAANQLDISGWQIGSLGNTKIGFCAVGGIYHVCKKLGVNTNFLNCTTRKDQCEPDYYAGGLSKCGVIAKNFKKPWHKSCRAESCIINFNDTRHPINGKELVQKALRKAARELEHGGVL
jgi:hypothetical protein